MTEFELSLVEQTLARVLKHDCTRIGLLGLTPAALSVMAELTRRGLADRVLGLFDPGCIDDRDPGVRGWSLLRELRPDLLVVCDDADKELLLRAYIALTGDPLPPPQVVVAGMAHIDYRDSVFDELNRPAMVPSYATGHPYTRIHLFQCLKAAAEAGLNGAVIELGSFKGGTTAWLAQVVAKLGLGSQVIGFDTWSGFPPPRSILDLYEHPRCVFDDLLSVRAYLEPLGIELIEGDIFETVPRRLNGVPVLLAFVDTDNYSATKAALEVIIPNLVRGGSIVLDHYWTEAQYIYTVGERIAAEDVLQRAGLLQIHGSGVFVNLGRTIGVSHEPQ